MTLKYPITQLGEVCDVLDSKRRPITKRDRIGGDFPYYGATGILDYVEGFLFDEPLVLIGEDGAKWGAGENTAFRAEGQYWVNNHAHVIRPHRHKVLDAWLIYQLNLADLSPFITGLTVPKLNQAKMREIPILGPPLVEQRRIVAVLDKAFAGIATATANAQKNLTNARALFDRYLQNILITRGDGWTDQPIRTLSETALGKMLDKQKNKGELRPYLRNINVRWFEFDLNDLLHMRFEPNETARYSVIRGDVVICEGGYPGRAAIWAADDPIFYQKALHRVRFRHSVMANWFVYILHQANATGDLKQHFTGSGIQHFTGQALRKFEIPVPPLDQLPCLIAGLDMVYMKTNLAIAKYKRKLSILTELKQSLLHKAFAGALT